MTFNDLASIAWEAPQSTADWTRLLNDLLGLTQAQASAAQRSELADCLDTFADRAHSDDLDLIIKLARSARRAARALRRQSIGDSLQELAAASADFDAAVVEFSAASAALKRETSLLRAEKLNAAVSSLTDTIGSLKTLSQFAASDGDEQLAAAIAQAMGSAQALRDLLEKPV